VLQKDLEALLIDPAVRCELSDLWRRGLAEIGLSSAADEASLASLMVEPPDHTRGPIGEARPEDSPSEG
jgi:hypothetical protein